VLEAGGKTVGEIVTLATSTGARVTWCYVADPEGNIIELEGLGMISLLGRCESMTVLRR